MDFLLDLLRALDLAGVRAVVVGGVAVVLHGHPRLTVDLDLVLDLSDENVMKALAVLGAQGLVPRLPVPAEQFADAAARDRWRRDRELVVFSLHDPANPLREVDLFAHPPIPFEELWAASRLVTVADVPVRVAAIEHVEFIAVIAGYGAPSSAQRQAWAATTPAERLHWLEEAVRFAAATGALARDRAQRARESQRLAAALALTPPTA
jgi:hypothetical protein